MKSLPKWIWLALALLLLLGLVWYLNKENEDPIDYNTQVKPILNKRCLHCHGGVKANSGLNLITRELALQEAESGQPAFIAGRPNQSEMIRRITSDDPDYRMPHEEPPLPQEEIEILTQWIEEGAKWGAHWAYNPVQAVAPPASTPVALGSMSTSKPDTWGNNPIDQFIVEGLQEVEMQPSPRAKKEALLRRLSLDLIGLPVQEKIKKKFLNEENNFSYEILIDSLLNMPSYGEKWAGMWLDLARYADTKGFERDPNRTIWPYRDWLIRAFNQDMPYDQFITEQLAGDLLPNSTDDQLIATGFHRNTLTNDEGGTNNDEYRNVAVLDRVNTTWEALMGTTFSCVQCHGHPYDPFFHDDYYESFAFFNNTRDHDTNPDYPWLRLLSKEDKEKLKGIEQWVAKVESPERAKAIKDFIKTWQPAYYSLEVKDMMNAALYDEKYLGLRNNGSARLPNIPLTDRTRILMRAVGSVDGGTLSFHKGDLSATPIASMEVEKTEGYQFIEIPLLTSTGNHDIYLKYENPDLQDSLKRAILFDWFHFSPDFPGKNETGYEEQQKVYWELMEAPAPITLIQVENPADRQRTTHVFDRGNWQVHNEKVQPKVPDIFEPLPADAPRNRLGLAQWITDTSNPLTARTFVNRIWEQLFGMGLVETVEDFGSQGTYPTHPELLDWLAHTFMHEYNWSVKKLIKLIVSSATYQQSAIVSKALLEKDPYNQLYARGPRVRLSAEQIRDQALQVSGLLNPKMYGPPVMPYQPDGIWNSPYGSDRWILSEQEDLYRRAIYTFIKRTAPYPSMETFDVAPRNVCVSRRIRTNTPLQALVTLNDPVFVETAKHLALKMHEAGSIEVQIQKGYELAIGQPIAPTKQEVFVELYQDMLKDYQNDPTAAKVLVGANNSSELAALTVVANAIMNLDAFLMK